MSISFDNMVLKEGTSPLHRMLKRNMESPETSRRKILEGDTTLNKISSTPTNSKIAEEFSLYYLHKDSSPGLRAGQDILEVGWGNSPEPLNVEKKSALTKTPITCKKKLESKESPVSTISSKRRNLRSNLRLPSSSIVDIAKYVAEVQELSKNIMKELNANKPDKETSGIKNQQMNCIQTQASTVNQKPILETCVNNTMNLKQENCLPQREESSFDNVLKNFIDEEDDWLSQAISGQESVKPIPKISFVKCKSENELSLSQLSRIDTKKSITCKTINNNIRRTASFDMTKGQDNLTGLNSKGIKCKVNSCNTPNGTSKVPQVQYSQQEIERKRLEAIYRRERKEIERKKMEALKKLEMKKLRTVQA